MFKHTLRLFWVVLLIGIPVSAAAQPPTVYGLFFFAYRCPHCQYLIREHLPLWEQEFGEQFQLIMVDIDGDSGLDLFRAASETPGIAFEAFGVPLMIIGDRVLLGHLDIAEEAPPIIRAGLAGSGIDLPPIPGLVDYMSRLGMRPPHQQNPVLSSRDQVAKGAAIGILLALGASLILGLHPSIRRRFSPHDGLVWGAALLSALSALMVTLTLLAPSMGDRLILIGSVLLILITVIMGLRQRWQLARRGALPAGWLNLLIPITAMAGLLVAGHLTAAELNATGTYCGLLGDCEVVQQSAYARLFGVIPIGALGVVGYGAIIVAAMVARRSTRYVAEWAYRALWFMITLGMIFSTYLTFLEPFVIDAVCAWCLISALIMLLLWWLLRLEALPLKSQQQSSEALAH